MLNEVVKLDQPWYLHSFQALKMKGRMLVQQPFQVMPARIKS
jgi:hypothetical protein